MFACKLRGLAIQIFVNEVDCFVLICLKSVWHILNIRVTMEKNWTLFVNILKGKLFRVNYFFNTQSHKDNKIPI